MFSRLRSCSRVLRPVLPSLGTRNLTSRARLNGSGKKPKLRRTNGSFLLTLFVGTCIYYYVKSKIGVEFEDTEEPLKKKIELYVKHK